MATVPDARVRRPSRCADPSAVPERARPTGAADRRCDVDFDPLLGTSVLVAGNHWPVPLAQRLATIDMLCGGRLAVGLGVGWSAQEHAATGTDIATRGARMDDFVDALRTCWADDPVSHDGAFFAIPPTIIRPKPVQVPHPPLLSGLWSPAGLDRTVRQFDGWNPAGMPVATTKSLLDELNARRAADQAPLTMHHRAFAQFPFAAAEQSRLFSRRSLTSLVGAS